jgi:hypothetical protein
MTMPSDHLIEIPLEAMAKSIAHMEDRIESHHKDHSSERFIVRTIGGSTVLTGATGIVEVPQRPAAGRIWNLLKVILTSTDGHTSLAGVIVDIYSSSLVDPNAPVLDSLVQGNLGVPSVTYYSRKVEWCQPQEEVYGLIYGGTAGQQVNLALRVAEYPVGAIESMVIR